MDQNDIRAGITLLSFLLFIGIMVWTWARRRKAGFEEAARLPFIDSDGERQ